MGSSIPQRPGNREIEMTVVYACIDSISQIHLVAWRTGNDESYKATKEMADRAYGDERILLVGRQDLRGDVEPVYARASAWNGWHRVSNMHVRLAQHFSHSAATDPTPKSARMLVELDCGGIAENVISDHDLHDAVSRLQSCLRALGVDRGDESYLPIVAACGRPNLSARAVA